MVVTGPSRWYLKCRNGGENKYRSLCPRQVQSPAVHPLVKPKSRENKAGPAVHSLARSSANNFRTESKATFAKSAKKFQDCISPRELKLSFRKKITTVRCPHARINPNKKTYSEDGSKIEADCPKLSRNRGSIIQVRWMHINSNRH